MRASTADTKVWTRVARRTAAGAHRSLLDLALVALDAIAVLGAYGVLLLLRFDFAISEPYSSRSMLVLPLLVLTHVVVNWTVGCYGQMWRFASHYEARRVLLAGTITIIGGTSVFVIALQGYMPVSVIVVGGILATFVMGTIRFESRLFTLRRSKDKEISGHTVRVAVIGAGSAGDGAVRQMLQQPSLSMRPCVIVDDDPSLIGRSLHQVPIVGPTENLQDTIEQYGVQLVLHAVPSGGKELARRASEAAERAGVPLKILPGVSSMIRGSVSVTDARDLEIDDLLGRDQVEIDLSEMCELAAGRRVLVTGGGGSIGSEIVRQVAAMEPAELVVLDNDETHLHDTAITIDNKCRQMLVDIRNRERVLKVMEEVAPDVVFHAAAHKHVPLLEAHPIEAVTTNVFGTKNVVDAATAAGVERLLFISTDKAVAPANVMGATKWLAEQIVLAEPVPNRCAVRFGNVLGSRGSVIPLFQRQIMAGGPVTVTDPDMTRFFMSIPEAVRLVLKTMSMTDGGEVFVLEMGEPVKIIDLAKRMIRLSGHVVDDEIPIHFTGTRPGEKLHEALHVIDDDLSPTACSSVMAIRPRLQDGAEISEVLEELELGVLRGDDEHVRSVLLALVARAHAGRVAA